MPGRGNDEQGQHGNQGGRGGQGGQPRGGQGQGQGQAGGRGAGQGQGQGQPQGQAQGQATPGQEPGGQHAGGRAAGTPYAQQGQGVYGAGSRSVTDYLSSDVTVAYTKFFGATYALVGAAAGLAVLLVSVVGGAPLAPDVAVDPGNFVENYEAIKNQYYVNRLAYQTMNAAPVVASVLGVVGGIYVGTNVDGPDEQVYTASGVATAAGAFVLVVLTGVLASIAIGTIPIPETTGAGETVAGTSSAQLQRAEGVASALLIGGTSLEFGGLLLNAIVTALATGMLAVGGAYVSRELAPAS